MSQDIFCNLAAKTFGRSIFNARRPIFYYGETETVNFFFEGYPDGYADALENIDQDGASLSVKIGPRGGTALVTASSWSNIATTVSPDTEFGNSNFDVKWDITPVTGWFSIEFDGTAVLPEIQEKGIDTMTYQLAYGEAFTNRDHTVFRNTSTGRINIGASDAEIEDRIKSLFHEIIEGVANVYISDDDTTTDTAHSYTAFSLANGVVTPTIAVSRPAQNTINVNCYVPNFEVENGMVYVLDDASSSSGVPYGAASWLGDHKDHIFSAKGIITIDDISMTNIDLKGPHGKTGSIATTAAGFGTLLGTANEVEAWMEVLLDSKTIADGRVLIRKRMS